MMDKARDTVPARKSTVTATHLHKAGAATPANDFTRSAESLHHTVDEAAVAAILVEREAAPCRAANVLLLPRTVT